MQLAILILAIVLLLAVASLYAAQNHLEQNHPFYTGNHAITSPQFIENLTVVSYNISYGRKIDQALREIKDFQLQQAVDILLLQEMEEAGTERIARELHLNYVYYPAAIEPKYRRNFGNAILSRWPIAGSQKLILPHISLSDRMKRAATRATIRLQDIDITAYSIHTEPVFILPKDKEDQCFAVLDDSILDARFVMIGGDFNAFTKGYVNKLEKRYQQAGFVRASQRSGYTFMRFGIKMSTDQIFTKGFIVKAAGKLANATASDHLPVWATLSPNRDETL